MIHIPLLRKGQPYQSLDVLRTPHYRSHEPFVEISQANSGLIRRDLRDQAAGSVALARFSCAELVEMCGRAALHFAQDELPLGDGVQTPQQYIEQVSATTGMPFVMGRRNLEKIRCMLAQMGAVLAGLTRGLDFTVLDNGWGDGGGQQLSYFPRTQSLGAVLPSNSPGVHSVWIPSIALKIPVVLKPGSAEPWTPYRIAQSLIRAGVPAEAFSYFPTDHAGAAEILRCCGRGILFGDEATTSGWKNDPRIELHGPGLSKIVIGEDCADEWESYLDVMVASIVENGGRSCVNASGIWAPRHTREIAEALAVRLAAIEPRDAADEQAQLAPFTDPDVARGFDQLIEQGLGSGAWEATAARRGGGRLAMFQECAYLLPTVIHCDGPEHPLANCEFLFPFASVVPVRQEHLPEWMGPTLALTAITRDPQFQQRLLRSPLVGRLNLGPIPTNSIDWRQPHEGNLFEHLYARRSLTAGHWLLT